MVQDLWTLCRIDVRDVFKGSCSAAWVLGFAERIFYHPYSVARGVLLAGEQWSEWYGWDKATAKIAESSDVLIATNTEKGKTPHKVWTPSIASTREVLSMEATAALLMSLNTG